VEQSTISRIITCLTPLVEQATQECRPTANEAAEATKGAIALVDGTLWPCWSWDGESQLWSGKYKTKAGGVFGDKGFIGTDYITTPIRKPECRELLQWEHEWNNQVSSFRAPVERAVATLKTWRVLFIDYRRP